MNKRRDRVCGADVHKDLIVATMTGDDVLPIRENFGTTKAELKRFRNWLVANECEQVAFEATGVYWMPIYDALSKTIDTIVANPLQIKTVPNDKSDSKDSNRIAILCLNGQIKRSRVFTDEDRDLRMITRARSGYVKTRTQFRNRIHKYLSSSGIKLSSRWSTFVKLIDSLRPEFLDGVELIASDCLTISSSKQIIPVDTVLDQTTHER